MSEETSRLLEPVICRAVDRGKPVQFHEVCHEAESRYGGGLVGFVLRRIAEGIERDIDAQALSPFALLDCMASLGLTPPVIPPRLPLGEALLWTDKGEPVRVQRLYSFRISDDELRKMGF